MNRFFVDRDCIYDNKIVITDREDVKHISKVLRLKEKDTIEVSDGFEFEYICNIKNILEEEILCNIKSKEKFIGESPYKIHLFQGMPKQGKLDTIVQKSVELGVFDITPVYMDRCVSVKNQKEDKKTQRQNTIALSAAKQSKRGIVPNVNKPIAFKEMIQSIKDIEVVIFPYENAEDRSIKDYLKDKSISLKTIKSLDGTYGHITHEIGVIIGPEGGFSEEEVSLLGEAGIEPVTLGKRILRTETAGPTVLSILLYELEL